MRFSGPLRAEKVVRKIRRRFLKLIPYTTTVHDWRILEPFRFYYDDDHPERFILVEKDWLSDLASIPGFLGFVLQKDGVYAQAAVTHDWSYKNRGDVVYLEPEPGVLIKLPPLSREEQDLAFLGGMKVLGTFLPTRVVMWRAVHRFGWISYPKK
jgi:hypothetical protein